MPFCTRTVKGERVKGMDGIGALPYGLHGEYDHRKKPVKNGYIWFAVVSGSWFLAFGVIVGIGWLLL